MYIDAYIPQRAAGYIYIYIYIYIARSKHFILETVCLHQKTSLHCNRLRCVLNSISPHHWG